MKAWQNQYDYGERVYDPRVGRFLSVDPLLQEYPWYSPYQYAGNQPVWATDLDGMEPSYAWQDKNGNWQLTQAGDNLAVKRLPTGHEQFMKNSFAGPDSDMGQQASDLLDWIPGVNAVKGYWEAGTGKQWFTGRQLSDGERALSLVPYGKKMKTGAKAITESIAGTTVRKAVKEEIKEQTNKQATTANAKNPNAAQNNTATSNAQAPNKGEYGQTGGHHVHAKAAFKLDVNYDANTGFSISQSYMNQKGWNHQAMTNKQRELFKDLANNGKPNTLTEHSNIAVQALQAGGATLKEARSLVAESLNNLRNQGVTVPTNIPWYK